MSRREKLTRVIRAPVPGLINTATPTNYTVVLAQSAREYSRRGLTAIVRAGARGKARTGKRIRSGTYPRFIEFAS